ncbi:hypothetical protein NHJ13734_008578 [Beauveria thailandica]
MAQQTLAMAQEEEIERLKRLIEQETLRFEEAKRRREQQTLRFEEEKRLREQEFEEEKRLREQETLRFEEAKRLREQETLRFEEEKRLREHAEQNLLRAIDTAQREREERNKTTRDQTLEDYLKSVHVLNYHMPRLLPPLTKIARTLSEGQQSESTSTTHGRADIRLFPSEYEVNISEKRLLEDLPEDFLESEGFISEGRSSYFICETLERPVQRIMNAYLSTTGSETQLYFDGQSDSWKMGSCSGSSVNSENSGSETETVTRQQCPKKLRPDCLVLRQDMLSAEERGGGSLTAYDIHEEKDPDSEETRTYAVSRVMVGEHKAFHRLRAAMLSQLLENAMAEDCMVRLARKTLMNKPGAETQSTSNIPGSIFFTYALAQTFHYMVTSGLEFGFLAAGESVSFLRVPRDDSTTLLYYTELFPQYCRPPATVDEAANETTIVDVNTLAISRLCSLTLLALESSTLGAREISIQLLKLAEFPKLPPSLREQSAAALSPMTTTPSLNRDSSRRDEADGDDNDENGDDDGGRSGGKMVHRPRNSSPLKKQSMTPGQQPSDAANDKASPAPRLTNGTQLGRGRCGLPSLPSPFDLVSFKPLRPYCTHLGLSSLMRGEDRVNYDCPNILLHIEAARRIRRTAAADRVASHHGHHGHHGHPIRPTELIKLIKQQLLNNVKQDCECLLSRGLHGAIGYLFRLTVTSFSYSLVAKGVQSFHTHRLRHKAIIYKKLAAQQGVLIPVCLSVVKLRLPYPITNGKLVTDMLLLSYAGKPLDSPSLQRRLEARLVDVDVDAEACRTLEELGALGVEDEDKMSDGNLTWCESVERVMKIDFDHVHLWEVQHPTTTTSAALNKKKRPADGPPEELVWEESRQKRWQQKQRHLTVTSLLLA